jgi:hypothetical protein
MRKTDGEVQARIDNLLKQLEDPSVSVTGKALMRIEIEHLAWVLGINA